MNNLQQKIKEEMVANMRAKNSQKVTTLRGLMSAFTNELVALKRKPQDVLSDEEALKVVQKQIKQRKDSIEQFEKGGRNDLADSEKVELAILEEYMPAQMSPEEIQKIVTAKKAELGINDKSQMGKFIGAVMKDLKGKADGQLVKEIVEKSF